MENFPVLGLASEENERQKSPISPKKEHTLGHVNCPACESLRTMLLHRITPDLPFSSAASIWLSYCRMDIMRGPVTSGYIKPTTYRCYSQYVRTLELFFGQLRLVEIHAGHIREYQRARLSGDEPFIRYRRPQDAKPQRKGKLVIPAKGKSPCPAKPEKVNQEMQVVIRLLKRAGLWNEEMMENYRTLLTEENDVPRALSPDEQQLWLYTSQLKKEWMEVHWYSVIAFQTTFGTNEMRGQRLGDISLVQAVTSIPAGSAKCRMRKRTVPLNTSEVLWAYEKLIERAKACGATSPQHYLLPFRRRGIRKEFEGYDPTRPMTESGMKKRWDEVRKETGLVWFRMYDTRHTAITRMAEAGVPLTVIQEYAGHISDRMRQHYTQISEQAKRRWGQHAFSNDVQSYTIPAARMPPQPVRPPIGYDQGIHFRRQ